VRVARRLDNQQGVDGVYRLDDGALREDFFDVLQELGVVDWRGEVQGTAVQRERVPCVPSLLRDSLKSLLGVESRHALPALLFRDAALRRLVGFKAQQVRHGVCQRGAAPRQGPRTRGPMCPDALADNIVKLNVRDLEAWVNGGIRALAKAGEVPPKVTGMVEATDLETTAQYTGWGHVTRRRKLTDTRGQMPAIEGTV